MAERAGEHVDLYDAHAFHPTYDFVRALRPHEVARAARGELPYWNGYVYYTEVHDESACSDYAPKDENGNQLSSRFRPATGSTEARTQEQTS